MILPRLWCKTFLPQRDVSVVSGMRRKANHEGIEMKRWLWKWEISSHATRAAETTLYTRDLKASGSWYWYSFFSTNSHLILCPSDTKVLSLESPSSSSRFASGLIMKRMGGDVSLSLFDSPGDSLHSRWIFLFRWRQSHTTVLSFETDSCSLLFLFLMMHFVSPFFTPRASCFSSISLSSHDFDFC